MTWSVYQAETGGLVWRAPTGELTRENDLSNIIGYDLTVDALWLHDLEGPGLPLHGRVTFDGPEASGSGWLVTSHAIWSRADRQFKANAVIVVRDLSTTDLAEPA